MTLHRRALLALCGFTVATGSMQPGWADNLRISEGFTPHPFVSHLIDREVDAKVYINDRFRCGSSFSTKDPWFVFHVDKPMRDVNVVFQNADGDNLSNAVLVFPNGAYACAKGGNVYNAELPAGKYQVWFFTSSQRVRATIRIEQPDRLKADVLTALDNAPQVEFADQPKTNPQFVSIPPAPSAHARIIETQCASGTTSVYPLARMKVERGGRFMVRNSRGNVLIESETGCITDEAARKNNILYNNEYVLKPGEYKVWALGDPADNAPATLEVDDLSKPLAFGDARRSSDLGTLQEPALLSASTQPAQRWPARRNACDTGPGAPRTPDFYIKSAQPLSRVRLSLYRNDKNLRLRIYGPLEDASPYQTMVCNVESMRFLSLEGTYAVWVSGPKPAAGSEFHIVALREDVEIDPMKTLLDIPEELTMEQRAVANHYPFFRDMSHGYLFPRAPERLFVYAARSVKTGEHTIPAGEPLVVEAANKDTFTLRRYDGTRVVAKRAELTTARPATVVLPTKPSFQPAATYEDAWRHVTPVDRPRVDRVRAVADKYRSCVSAWMAENDPTWGKSYDLVYLSGPAQGKTLTDIKFDEAAGVCNEAGVRKAEESFRQQMNAAAKQRATSHLRSVRKRFAL